MNAEALDLHCAKKKLSRQETPNSVCERTPTRSEGKFARHLQQDLHIRVLLHHLLSLVPDLAQDLCMRILVDHLYQDPVGPLVQDLCVRVLWTSCVRILWDHLCKISASGSFWTTASGSCWTTGSGSCWTTCGRSVFQDLCVRILWTTCIRILQERLYKIPVMMTLVQDLLIRIL